MRKNEIISKDAIVAEYNTSDITLRELEAKYGYPYSSICHWVNGRNPSKKVIKKRRKQKKVAEVLTEDFMLLHKTLLKTQLHNKLLEEIIRLAEKQTGLDLRKKAGTKRS